MFASATLPTRDYYTFAGWTDGSNDYAARDIISNVSGNITLTAKWTPVSYTITYNENGIVEGVVGVKLLNGSTSRDTYNDLYEVLQVFESAIAEKKDPTLATEKLLDEFTSVSEILKQPAAFTVDGSAQFAHGGLPLQQTGGWRRWSDVHGACESRWYGD